MALDRLSSNDFQPCQDDDTWLLPTHMLDKITGDLCNIIPELRCQFSALPYMMATYKLHKQKYRWLTNAHNTIFSELAHILTIATMPILEAYKSWAAELAKCYKQFLQVETSLFWLVNSTVEVALNLPTKIIDIYVVDITRCYESIPLEGKDNLHDAVAHLIETGYKQEQNRHPKAIVAIWILFNDSGQAAKAIWSTSAPAYGTWVPFDKD